MTTIYIDLERECQSVYTLTRKHKENLRFKAVLKYPSYGPGTLELKSVHAAITYISSEALDVSCMAIFNDVLSNDDIDDYFEIYAVPLTLRTELQYTDSNGVVYKTADITFLINPSVI